MTEPRGDRRGWPLGLAGALILIAAVEAMVGLHEVDFTNPSRMEWRLSRRAATAKAPGCAVLGLGTSMTKLGLYSSVVERESGLKTFNLAYCAGRIPGSYYLLRHALEAGARPEAVLLEAHPTYLAMPFQEGMVAWPDQLDAADVLDLAREARDPIFFASTMLGRLLPTLNSRPEIRSAILAAFKGLTASNRVGTSSLVRNVEKNAGSFVFRRALPYGGEVSPYLAALYLQPGWSCDKLNERYLRRTLDLCAAKKIKVFWLIPPFVPLLQALREQMGNDGAYVRFAERIQAEYPGLVVIDSRRSGYQPAVFFDAAHLEYAGAVTFSAEVGRAVKAGLKGSIEGSRWVDLPAYRDRSIETPLEDIAQSMTAVSDAATLKR